MKIFVSVNYPGDNKYSSSSNQTSFNVRKINTNLSIDTIDDTTIESDITISGILKDEFGNIIVNKGDYNNNWSRIHNNY